MDAWCRYRVWRIRLAPTWTADYGASTANATSPLTVNTSASQLPLVIPPGGSLCLSVTLTHNTGGKPSMLCARLPDWAACRGLIPR